MILFKQFAGKERGLSRRDDLSEGGREGVGRRGGQQAGRVSVNTLRKAKSTVAHLLLQKVEEAGVERGGGGGGGGTAEWEVHGPKEPK